MFAELLCIPVKVRSRGEVHPMDGVCLISHAVPDFHDAFKHTSMEHGEHVTITMNYTLLYKISFPIRINKPH